MSWGGLIGMGKGVSAVGQSIDEDLKAARVNEWRKEAAGEQREYDERKLAENREWEGTQKQLDREYEKEQLAGNRDYDREKLGETRAYDREQKQLDRQSSEGIRSAQAQAQAERDRVNNANRLEAARIRSSGGFEGLMNGEPEDNDDLRLARAEKYADKIIDEKAGYLSRDSSDFKQFGGSREKARQFYIQEYMRQNGGQSGGGNNLGALLKNKFGQ